MRAGGSESHLSHKQITTGANPRLRNQFFNLLP